MTELDNRVDINVQILDITVTRQGFGILAIVHEHDQATARVETYTSLTDLLAIFPSYTPVGKLASIAYSQAFVPEQIKVIERENGETVTQALDAAVLVDNNFYGIGLPGDLIADQQAGAAWALANGPRLFLYSSQDSTAEDATITDIFAVLKGLTNNRAAGWYSQTSGLEFEIDTLTVAGTTCTADITDHATQVTAVGDTVGIWDSAEPGLNGTFTVLTIGALDFTFTVPSGTVSDLTSSKAWVNFNLIDAGIAGKMLPQDAGVKTWDIQPLSGVTADKLTGTAQTNLGTKNANWYTSVGGLNITGGSEPGGGGKTASGRYIDVQRGADWLKVNLQADLFALMVNEGGSLGYDADGLQKVEQTISLRLDDGLTKGFLTPFVTGRFAGKNYNIAMPNLADIPQDNKTNRLLEGIKINALIRGKIHNLAAALTLST